MYNIFPQVSPTGAASTKPTALEPFFAGIPNELRALPNWIMWRYEPPARPDNPKWRKVPCRIDGKRTDAANRTPYWTTFDACRAAYRRGMAGTGPQFDGIGFCFDGEIGPDGFCLTGVDFDNCCDGNVIELRQRSWIKRLNTYWEQSPSGHGVHCICRSRPYTLKTGNVEIYSRGRYFTFTGHGTENIRAADDELQALIAEVRTEQTGREGRQQAPGVEIATAFAHLDPNQGLGQGVEAYRWFDPLKPEQKDEVVDYALEVITNKTPLFEIQEDGGDNGRWYRLTTAVARSGAPQAEKIFIKYASAAKSADPEDVLREYFAQCRKNPRGITVGTLLGLALEHGADFDKWRDLGQESPSTSDVPPLPFINFASWDHEPIPEYEWSVLGRYPLRQTVLSTGEGAVGKSSLKLQLAAAHTLCGDWLGVFPAPGPAIFVDAEDDTNVLHIRLAAILRHYGATFADAIKGGLHLISLVGRDAVLGAPTRNGKIEPTALYKQLLEAAGDIKPKMIGIASSADVFAGNEIDRSQVRQFIGLLTRIAIAANGTVSLIAHPSLTGINTGTGLSGSTHWHNAVRARDYMTSIKPTENGEQPDTDLRQIIFKKNQYGPVAETIVLRYQDGLFLPEAGVDVDQAARQLRADEVFLELLLRLRGENRYVSANKSAIYAPAIFAREDAAKKARLNGTDFAGAMVRLFAAKKVWNEPYGKPSRPSYRLAPTG
jgi:RecA-family ATPase